MDVIKIILFVIFILSHNGGTTILAKISVNADTDKHKATSL